MTEPVEYQDTDTDAPENPNASTQVAPGLVEGNESSTEETESKSSESSERSYRRDQTA